MQFHNGIEESLLLTIERNAELSSAADVVNAVDLFCYSRHWMMHIGPVKGKILDDVILSAQGSANKPLVCVELGSYCGYSTIRIASQFKNENSIIYSIEREPTCCAWTRRLCNKAGLSSKVKILEGGVEAGIESLLKEGVQIDVLFIDHDKIMYLNDLKLFEAAGLLTSPGAVVVADNVLSFGVPLVDYLQHVRRPVEEGGRYSSSVLHRRTVEYSTVADSVENGDALEDGIEISFLR
jgi:catechol O-methyltransferase